jgi:hypothetical protein
MAIASKNDTVTYLNEVGERVAAEVVVLAGSGSGGVTVKAANYVPMGDQQFTIAALASKQVLTIPTGATVAVIQNNTTQAMRWRDSPSGADPTATVGQRIPAGDQLAYDGDLSKFEIIREADGTGTVDVWYGA